MDHVIKREREADSFLLKVQVGAFASFVLGLVWFAAELWSVAHV